MLEEAKRQNLELEAMRAKYTKLMEKQSLHKSEVAEKAIKELKMIIESKEQLIFDKSAEVIEERNKSSGLKVENKNLQTKNEELEEHKGVLEDEKRVQKEEIEGLVEKTNEQATAIDNLETKVSEQQQAIEELQMKLEEQERLLNN